MKLIVGLGNIGHEYEKTRHNVGFMAIDKIADKYSVSFSKEKFCGLYGEFIYEGEKIILLKPEKYMNLSGEVIKDYIKYFKIDLTDLFVISDDLDMPLGKIKLKLQGSSGGHNGLKNIIENLHTDEFCRLKIGISNNKTIDTKDYVLGKFTKEEEEGLNKVLDIIPNLFCDYMKLSFDNLMTKYNKK